MNVGCLLFPLPVCVSGRPVYLQSRRYYIRLSEQKRVEAIYISFFCTVVVYYVILAHLMADTMAPLNVSTRMMNKMHSNRKRYVSNGAPFSFSSSYAKSIITIKILSENRFWVFGRRIRLGDMVDFIFLWDHVFS